MKVVKVKCIKWEKKNNIKHNINICAIILCILLVESYQFSYQQSTERRTQYLIYFITNSIIPNVSNSFETTWLRIGSICSIVQQAFVRNYDCTQSCDLSCSSFHEARLRELFHIKSAKLYITSQTLAWSKQLHQNGTNFIWA